MLHLVKYIHTNDILYVATCIATFIVTICFSHIIKYYVFKHIRNRCLFFLDDWRLLMDALIVYRYRH